MLAIIVLAAVFLLIAVRQIGNIRLQIWLVMLGGALAVLLLGQISPEKALASINLDVMLFLFGMFVVGRALEESGYLSYLSYGLFHRAKSMDGLLLLVIFTAGLASAFLMNDTLAIIGTPVVLLLSRRHGWQPKALLLALAFSITIGSAMSPIGNPQNLLIAVNSGIENPFVDFFGMLLIPTLINLAICFFLLRFACKGHFTQCSIDHHEEPVKDEALTRLARLSLAIILILVLLKIAFVFLFPQVDFRLTYIALAAAFPILAFSPRRLSMIKNIDWPTLVFFAAMFVLMESVWDSGFFQPFLAGAGASIVSLPAIFASSIILSQFISNVPLVALYLPILLGSGAQATALVALAAGSTIAGNLTILGAASNVIIIQNAESRGEDSLSFIEFTKIGVPLTLANALVYWGFLSLF